MKRYLVYSLVFHVLLLSLALFLVQEKKEKSTAPFYARIVTPEELRREGLPGGQKSPVVVPPRVPQRRSVPKAGTRKPTIREGKKGTLPASREAKKLPEEKPSGLLSGERPSPGTTVPPSSGLSVPQQGITGSQSQPGSRGGNSTRNSRGSSPAPKPLREKIFDRDIIGDLAHKEKEPPKPDANLTFDTREFKYYGYMRRLKEKIESSWNYPQEAAERGIYGDLYIKFTIKKDGYLGAVELVRTSGHKNLDDAAIRALRRAEPYWPLPDDWGNEGLTITGHFIYTLSGTYLR